MVVCEHSWQKCKEMRERTIYKTLLLSFGIGLTFQFITHDGLMASSIMIGLIAFSVIRDWFIGYGS